MLREDLFYATYVELVVEKEARSIQNDPRDAINHDRMIVPRGANHGIGTFETTPQKA